MLRWLRRFLLSALLLSTLWLPNACGPAVIGAAAASAGGPGANATTTLSSLRVGGQQTAEAKVAPARVQFVLSDAESDPQGVDLLYTLPSSPSEERLIIQLQAAPATFASSPGGTEHELHWRFPAEAGIPADGSLIEGVQVIARVRGGGSAQVLPVRLGNDAPAIEVLPPDPEVRGVAPVRFVLSDSSDDVVDVRVEFFDEGAPQAGWQLARPGGIAAAVVTPELAFRGVVAPRGGAEFAFFWDTDRDLARLERDVRLRFTPIDPVVAGTPVESDPFRVDNNAEPIVQIEDGALIANPDQRRGIPIPYRVVDEEGDPVRVLFQWRHESASGFPDLGTSDPDQLAVLLRDPEFVRAKQVCTQYPRFARGLAEPIDSTHVRLPDLLDRESWIVRDGIEGLDLELLRPVARPTLLGPTWPSNPLQRPVAALPVGDGLMAVVLDDQGGTSRLLEIELATGAIVRTIASGAAGTPTAMVFTRDERAVLVATDQGGFWRLLQVDLDSGAATLLLDARGGGPTGPLRALAAMSTRSVLATGGDAVWKLDWIGPQPAVRRIVGGLAEPWGLAVDPVRDGRVYVAERTAAVPGGTGRVVSIEIASRAVEEVVAIAPTGGQPAFPSPTALAFHRTANRLVVMCQPAGADRELRGLMPGRAPARVFALGNLPATAATLALGDAELTLIALPNAAELLADGGIEQRRILGPYDRPFARAAVTVAFAPLPRLQQVWRIRPGNPFQQVLRGSAAGERRQFLWDSDAAGGGPVRIQALCFDSEEGLRAVTTLGRQVRHALQVEPVPVDLPSSFLNFLASDLDSDGDLDFATTHASDLTVFLQSSPGSFSAPVTIGGPGITDLPILAAADLDADGDLDLVSANQSSRTVTVFYQTGAGVYSAPLTLTVSSFQGGPQSIATGDLDQDGDVDMVAGYSGGLALFFQLGPGVFSPPMVLGTADGGLVVVDVDGDSDLDLVQADTVFLQSTPGAFSAPLALGLSGGDVAPQIADLDGDGDMDFVAAGQGLLVVFQDAPGVFAPPRSLTLLPGTGTAVFVASDLDGDGLLDLVSVRGGIELPHGEVFYQTVPGEFAAPVAVDVGALSRVSRVVVGDYDGNGLVDLACSTQVGNVVSIIPQVTPRVFSRSVTVSGIAFTDSADVDGDGRLDLYGVSQTQAGFASLVIVRQGAVGSFPDVPDQVASTPQQFSGDAVADLDGDGAPDLVAAYAPTPGRGRLQVFFQIGPGMFSAPLALDDVAMLGGSPLVRAIDLDSDGDLDLVAKGRSGGPGLSVVFVQEAPGVFSAAIPVGDSSPSPFPLIADLDADGDLDLGQAVPGGQGIALYFQITPGVYSAPSTLPGANEVALAGDVDGDGDTDLLGQTEFGQLAVFYQTAPGVFSAPSAIGLSGLITAPVMQDFDVDGDLDVAWGTAAGLEFHFQGPPGSFGAPVVLSGLSAPLIADVDGDGDHDVVANNGFPGLVVSYQTAPGAFAPPVVLDAIGDGALALADADGDGDLDLLEFRGGAVVAISQLAPGAFDVPRPLATTFFFPRFDARDMDGDGEVDFVMGWRDSVLGGRINILWGGR